MSIAMFRKRGTPPESQAEKAPSKKELAFELFDQGKTLDAPEVVALGLKLESAKKYFRLWNQQH